MHLLRAAGKMAGWPQAEPHGWAAAESLTLASPGCLGPYLHLSSVSGFKVSSELRALR